MGKYMRKAKTAADVALMEVAQSSLGVRTRARTLALQRLQKSSPAPATITTVAAGGSYLQLRSRRLEKPPIDHSKRQKQQQQSPKQTPVLSPKPNSRKSRLGVGSELVNEEGGNLGIEKLEESFQENKNGDLGGGGGGEASCGENVLEFEGRERSTRESTPCSLIRDPESIRTPGSTTRPTCSTAASGGVQNSMPSHIPTACEMDNFFSGPEEQQQKQFMDKTIRRIWQRGRACIANGLAVNVSNKRSRAVGRKRVEIDINKISTIPFKRRSNIRSFSSALAVPKSVLHRRIKEGLVRPHSNALKPHLSEEAMRSRLQFCVSMLEPTTLQSQPRFKSMYDYVHIDEKWFYMSKESHKYYLLPEELEPYRTCKSKRFITKVMFLAAVARPRFDPAGNEEFSGKIGIFPFTFKEPAKRSSKNRPAGTMETKAIVSVTKDIYRSCLIEKVLPAIRSKWPRSSATEPIYLQQDNAKPHISPLDADFVEAANKDGFNMRLSFQPPQSPDMNVLDLGYFRAIQSLQHQEAPRTIDELVRAVEKSFEEMSSDNLNRVFLSLQACMIEVMKVNGGNNYKLPHIGKGQMLREGSVVSSLECEPHVLQNAMVQLQQ